MPKMDFTPGGPQNEQKGGERYPLEYLIGLQKVLQDGIPEEFIECANGASGVCAPQLRAEPAPLPRSRPNRLTQTVRRRLLAMMRLVKKVRARQQALGAMEIRGTQ